MINVTKPFLPPFDEYQKLMNGIWIRGWLTNNGPLVNELEIKLQEYLGVPHMLFLNNGTIALQIAIKALGLTGEIITTPFSYVATTSSIVWEGCKPIFADIDPNTLNIDPKSIEKMVTSKTTAILATHVYGNPCDIAGIEKVAARHGLKVIYDAAHCFGTRYNGKSVFTYGDISTTSFHATKVFHTVEGGAVFTNDSELLRKMSFMRNFGHNGPEDFFGVGINGKNSEFHAAMGVVNLRYIDSILKKREEDCLIYKTCLAKFKYAGIQITEHSAFNFAYFPIILSSEQEVVNSIKELNRHNIFPRRYFYPSLSKLNYVGKQETPICDDISNRVLCLPLYYDIEEAEIEMICRLLIRIQNYRD